jgi:hypothetical protein
MPSIPPPLDPVALLGSLTARNDLLNADVTDAANKTLHVVCAWPVSGQYGPGTRVLYYVLIAACVFARKADWIKNAALAAALILPVVAAIHGIVLAIVHTDGKNSTLRVKSQANDEVQMPSTWTSLVPFRCAPSASWLVP